ncbi:tripartite tricarboxylate transporter TctB family protein [Peptostreptococcus stomatis]
MKIYHKVLVLVGLLIGSMLILQEISEIRITKMTDQFGPKLLPMILCLFIFLSSSILVIFSRKTISISKLGMKASFSTLVYYASIFVYILSLQYLGFVVSSLVFVEFSALFLGGKSVIKRIYVFFYLLITVVVAYFLFEYILHMNLPKGLFTNGVI